MGKYCTFNIGRFSLDVRGKIYRRKPRKNLFQQVFTVSVICMLMKFYSSGFLYKLRIYRKNTKTYCNFCICVFEFLSYEVYRITHGLLLLHIIAVCPSICKCIYSCANEIQPSFFLMMEENLFGINLNTGVICL